jgi:hypothetical protein
VRGHRVSPIAPVNQAGVDVMHVRCAAAQGTPTAPMRSLTVPLARALQLSVLRHSGVDVGCDACRTLVLQCGGGEQGLIGSPGDGERPDAGRWIRERHRSETRRRWDRGERLALDRGRGTALEAPSLYAHPVSFSGGLDVGKAKLGRFVEPRHGEVRPAADGNHQSQGSPEVPRRLELHGRVTTTKSSVLLPASFLVNEACFPAHCLRDAAIRARGACDAGSYTNTKTRPTNDLAREKMASEPRGSRPCRCISAADTAPCVVWGLEVCSEYPGSDRRRHDTPHRAPLVACVTGGSASVPCGCRTRRGRGRGRGCVSEPQLLLVGLTARCCLSCFVRRREVHNQRQPEAYAAVGSRDDA